MNRFIPDLFLDAVFDLDLDDMRQRKIRAIIFDIDNTLVTYDDAVAPQAVKDWFQILHGKGFQSYIISNNNEIRVKRFADSLDIPYFYKALKPRKRYLKKACQNMGVLPEETALMGDQLITDIYGGNRMGMYTILVKAISDQEHWFVKWKRNLEKWILKGVK